MPAPVKVKDLVNRFQEYLEAYKSGKYNETQVRREFIDPFFKELGWDIDNEQGAAEAYKDVIHEATVKVGGATKAPDYCFRIGGARKFFLEAKKPSINIKDDPHPAFQLRRYAWSAKLQLSIVTDFEELAVYDCRTRPTKSDKPSKERVMYFTFDEYIDRWDEIAGIFSLDAIRKGSFDNYADSNKKKRGTAEVDSVFLEEIEAWREALAKNLALRNPELSQRELNYTVQATIDRIIFLRICEDRGIEEYGRLMALQNGDNVYQRLCELFRQADDRYNSGLFHFQKEKDRPGTPDGLTLTLNIDDKVLKGIFKHLYYPDSPYEFSVLPADILGQVYEQFLGKVIRLTDKHRAVIEEKPEVKKAGGVYYTPTYIVDYIVKHTVGKLLEGKTARQAANLKILDPACGSGSFLIGAYQCLLDWHRDWYVNDGPEKHKKLLYQGQGGEWRLSTDERKRILLKNIYGVDIDSQAVEVTKLSLLLKVLEGETSDTLSKQMALFHARALPDLRNNIKCGNSLISPEIYQQQQIGLLDDGEHYRINAFDWQAEFSETFKGKNGGFDAVIGNPPWGSLFSEIELEYLRQNNREIIVRMIDSFMYFVFQGTKKLKSGAYFGMILPDVIMYQKDNEKLRDYVAKYFKITNLVNMGDVFEKVTRPACIIVLKFEKPNNNLINIGNFVQLTKLEKQTEIWIEKYFQSITQKLFEDIPGRLFITSDPYRYEIWKKVKNSPHELLKNIVDDDGIQRGVSPDLKEAFLVDSDTAKKHNLESFKLRRVLTGGKHVKRYYINKPDLLLIYTTRNDDCSKIPNICSFIKKFKEKITCKEVKQNKHPIYALHRARKEHIFLKENKLLGVITDDEIIIAPDDSQIFVTDGLYLFGIRNQYNTKYLMGVLNSSLFIFIYRLLSIEGGRVLAQVKPTTLAQLPIRLISFDKPQERKYNEDMIMFVEKMINLREQLASEKIDHNQNIIQRQIDSTDHQIDQLVYELYGLTDEEIRIVEESATKESGTK